MRLYFAMKGSSRNTFNAKTLITSTHVGLLWTRHPEGSARNSIVRARIKVYTRRHVV